LLLFHRGKHSTSTSDGAKMVTVRVDTKPAEAIP
jgi:hypothetical protein